MKTVVTLFVGLIIGAAAVIGGYFLISDDRADAEVLTLVFTEEEIQEKLSRKFPREEKVKGLITIVIEEPTVSFLGNDNRLRLKAKARIEIPFLDPEEVTGTFTSSVRYNQEDHTLRTSDYEVESLKTELLPEKYEPFIRSGFTAAARELFDDQVIHTVKDEEWEDQLARLFLQELKVKKGRLEVVLGL